VATSLNIFSRPSTTHFTERASRLHHIRQDIHAYVSIYVHISAYMCQSPTPHTSAYTRIRQHICAYVSTAHFTESVILLHRIRQYIRAYVSIYAHTSVYMCQPPAPQMSSYIYSFVLTHTHTHRCMNIYMPVVCSLDRRKREDCVFLGLYSVTYRHLMSGFVLLY
jgi:hypothetical protein